jgi:hypothetical protein
MVRTKQIAVVATVALFAAGIASGATFAATTGAEGAKACVTSGGALKLLMGNGSCPAGSSPAVLGAQGPSGPAGAGILSGAMPPARTIGAAGDYYIDTVTHFIYGPASHHCLPLPCSTGWGRGTSLVGPAGPANTSSVEGSAYQSTGFADLPNGGTTVIASLALSTAGLYAVTATVHVEHSGNDSSHWVCSLLGAEPNGDGQNYVESDASIQGDGASSDATLPLVAGVEVGAREKLEVSCVENQAQKGDDAGVEILATAMSSIEGAFNP